MQSDEHADPSAGSCANWKTIRTTVDPTIPKQVGDTCGHCVVQMILTQLNHPTDFQTISKIIGHDAKTNATEIAFAINALLRENRAKPVFAHSHQHEFALYHPHWWIAMIKEYKRDAHWVLVRGNGDSETLDIMDPADATWSLIQWSEFESLWTQVAVIVL